MFPGELLYGFLLTGDFSLSFETEYPEAQLTSNPYVIKDDLEHLILLPHLLSPGITGVHHHVLISAGDQTPGLVHARQERSTNWALSFAMGPVLFSLCHFLSSHSCLFSTYFLKVFFNVFIFI